MRPGLCCVEIVWRVQRVMAEVCRSQHEVKVKDSKSMQKYDQYVIEYYEEL